MVYVLDKLPLTSPNSGTNGGLKTLGFVCGAHVRRHFKEGGWVYMDECAETQRKIFGIIEGIKKDIPGKGKEWNKFYGDIVCRIFIEFISKEIAPKYKIVGPNAYIRGFPMEFDILIVDKDAEHDKFVNAFEPEKVRCGVESKAHGIFGGRSELKKDVERIKQNFVRGNKEYPHILFSI